MANVIDGTLLQHELMTENQYELFIFIAKIFMMPTKKEERKYFAYI